VSMRFRFVQLKPLLKRSIQRSSKWFQLRLRRKGSGLAYHSRRSCFLKRSMACWHLEQTSTTGDVALLGDPSHKGLIAIQKDNSSTVAEKLDVVFPALHGPFGEDGTLQGLLEMADVPYVGCGVLASSCGMDKVTMKSLFAQAGLPICKHTWFLRSQWRANPDKILRKVKSEIGLPCFVKPANLGSSVGVSRAKDKKTLSDAIDWPLSTTERSL
jgi:D-alanine-D-alanine ligase and related ATP-grasp enzymes